MFIVKQAVVYVNCFECNSLLRFCKGFVVKHVNYSEFRDCGKLTKFLTQDRHLTSIKLVIPVLASDMAAW